MIEILLVAVPAALGLLCFVVGRRGAARPILVGGSLAHAALTVLAWRSLARAASAAAPDGAAVPAGGTAAAAWLGIDPLGLLFLSVTSLLFVAVAFAAAGFLAREGGGAHADPEEGFVFANSPQGIFAGSLLLFLSAMSLVALSRHFGLLWVAIEATTLVTATLIHYHRHHRSLEAAWKYLMVCSVGIALALLGNFFLAAAAAGSGGSLGFAALAAAGSRLDPRWLRPAALLLVVGYGTKMGLVPMHTWLPDAHSEAPSVISALLSGALLNCAFLGLLRMQGVLASAGLVAYGQELFLALGYASMGGAAVFIVAQRDYKRLLAYSSVENMGILAVGIGLGGVGTWGALYHAVNHSLAKAALFLVAGNILAHYQSKRVDDARGLLRSLPLSGALWLAGFVAIAGMPPFGSFLSELAILRAALASGRWAATAGFLVFLAIAFVGLAAAFTRMAQGTPGPAPAPGAAPAPGGAPAVLVPAAGSRESAVSVVPPLALLACAAALGIVVPGFLDALISAAARLVGGAP